MLRLCTIMEKSGVAAAFSYFQLPVLTEVQTLFSTLCSFGP